MINEKKKKMDERDYKALNNDLNQEEMTTKPINLSSCCNGRVKKWGNGIYHCTECGYVCTIAENNQSVSAEEVLSKYENSTDHFADQDYSKSKIILAMEAYSNIVNTTIIRKAEQLKIEATVNLKTMEALDKALRSIAQVVKDEYGEAGMTNTGNKIYKKILALTNNK